MKTLLTCILSMLYTFASADQFITGNLSVTPGTVETYTANWPSWGSIYENNAIVTWNVTGGTVIVSDKHTVTIQWDDVPAWLNGNGYIEVYEDLGSQASDLSVNLVNYIEAVITSCSGILGTPTIAIDFGKGFNPGPPLPVGQTTYQYVASCNVQPDEYSIKTNTAGCNSNWLVLNEDHTPNDVNGYMFIVDGSENKGEVFSTTVTGLTRSFGYEFSVYIANLADPQVSGGLFERPNLNIEIRNPVTNALIQNSNTYRIEYDPADPWKKISFLFDLPLGLTSVKVVLVNDHNKRLGNDFAVDDISFAPCYPPILASFSNTSIVDQSYACNNGTVNLYSRWPTPFIPFNNPGFRWQRSVNSGSWADIPGGTTLNFVKTETAGGVYHYRMYAYEISNPSQYVISNVINFYVQKLFVSAKTYEVYNCTTTPVKLIPTYFLLYGDPNKPPTYSYNWSPATYLNNPNIESPLITLPALPPPPINLPPPPPIVFTYTLTVQTTNFTGCVASSIQTVKQYNPRKVAVPAAFTPGASTNYLFRPLNLQDYQGGEFWVWNRWGNLVFHSTGPTLIDFSWNGNYSNGQPADIGSYPWRVTIPGCPNNILNGITGNNLPYGQVTLIR